MLLNLRLFLLHLFSISYSNHPIREYDNEIVTPIPNGTIVSELKVTYSQQTTQPSIDSPIPSFFQGYQVSEEVLPGQSKFPLVPPPVNASESFNKYS